MAGLRVLLHVAFLGYYSWAVYADYLFIPPSFLPVKNVYWSRFAWLTMIDLFLQLFYQFWAVLASLGAPLCSKSFHFLARVFIQPLGLAVPLLFWGLLFYDPKTLIENEQGRKLLEFQALNHAIHTFPAVTALFDILLWNHGSPRIRNVLLALLTFSALYIADLHYIHHVSGGFWPYPILAQLDFPGRVAFILACVFVIFACYGVAAIMNRIVNGKAGLAPLAAKQATATGNKKKAIKKQKHY